MCVSTCVCVCVREKERERRNANILEFPFLSSEHFVHSYLTRPESFFFHHLRERRGWKARWQACVDIGLWKGQFNLVIDISQFVTCKLNKLMYNSHLIFPSLSPKSIWKGQFNDVIDVLRIVNWFKSKLSSNESTITTFQTP